MIARYVWFSILALAFSAASTLTKGSSTSVWDWFSSFASNLGAGFAASLLTAFLIDRAIESARQDQANRVRRVAFSRLGPVLLEHVEFLFNLHKASATEKPDVAPVGFADLFSLEYYDSIRYLDFWRDAPALPARDWVALSDQRSRSFKDALDRIADTYATFLDAETIETIGELQNSGFSSLLMQLPLIQLIDKSEGFVRRVGNQLYDTGVIALARSHVSSVLKLLDQVNRYSTQPIRLSDLPLWRTDVSPAIGSARLDPNAIQWLQSQAR